jgi:hypothetical protein
VNVNRPDSPANEVIGEGIATWAYVLLHSADLASAPLERGTAIELQRSPRSTAAGGILFAMVPT